MTVVQREWVAVVAAVVTAGLVLVGAYALVLWVGLLVQRLTGIW